PGEHQPEHRDEAPRPRPDDVGQPDLQEGDEVGDPGELDPQPELDQPAPGPEPAPPAAVEPGAALPLPPPPGPRRLLVAAPLRVVERHQLGRRGAGESNPNGLSG